MNTTLLLAALAAPLILSVAAWWIVRLRGPILLANLAVSVASTTWSAVAGLAWWVTALLALVAVMGAVALWAHRTDRREPERPLASGWCEHCYPSGGRHSAACPITRAVAGKEVS